MYRQFYGLRERPFDLTPNPRFLFLTAQHREALATIKYGISGQKGITVLIGEAGTGKTTLVQAALQSPDVVLDRVVYLNNSSLSRTEFFEFLAPQFGLSERAATSKARFLLEMNEAVTRRHAGGAITALIIDEAQSLPDELLEEVRLLANLETSTTKLLPVVLTGQPELADRLNQPSLRQLKQRVALRCSLDVLTLQETAACMAWRIQVAGGSRGPLFTREAVETIHRRSRGIPRAISVICDNALVSGFALNQCPVTRDTVLEVCRDFDLDATQSDGEFAVGTNEDLDGRTASRLIATPSQPCKPTAGDSQSAQRKVREQELFTSFGQRRPFFFFGPARD